MVELRNISLLMVGVSIVSVVVINFDALNVYASDWLGMTQDIVQLHASKQDTTVINKAMQLTEQEVQNIIAGHELKQLAIHPVAPVESVLKQKINNYAMPFNTLPPVNKILIPGINVDAPIIADYSKTPEQVANGDFDTELLKWVAKYPATPNPGQNWHTLLFGHSSSEAWNRSQYNAIFAQLPNLKTDDTFSIVWNGQLYDYKIVEKDIIIPSKLQKTFSKRETTDKNYLTLITCRPIGTTQKRMTVTAELVKKWWQPTLAYNE